MLTESAPASEWLLEYCEHLRGIAAGRGGDGGLELSAERAALAREQRIRIAMQNAVTRKELAPVYVLEQVLARAGARAAKMLDTITPEIRRRVPQLGSSELAAIGVIVAKARNVAASVRLADLEADDDERGDSAAVLLEEPEVEGP